MSEFNTPVQTEHVDICFDEESGIFRVVLKASSRDAIDQWMDYCERLIEKAPDQKPIKMLVINRQSQEMSVQWMDTRVRRLMGATSGRPRFHLAILRNMSPFMSLIAQLMQVVARRTQDKVRLFQEEQESQAVEWLRRSDEKAA